mgnify:CR=1 FL=1
MKVLPVKLYQAHKGYSLVELLIAMSLGLFVMAGVLTVFSDNSRIYKVLDARSRMQENARYALYVLGRDIRMAGYMSCDSSTRIANTVDSSNWQFWGDAVSGYEGGVSVFPAEFSADMYTSPNAPVNPDALALRRADSDENFIISSHNANSATIHFAEDKSVEKGEIYVIANPQCTQLGIFQASGPASAGPHNHIVHNTGGSTTPGNCTKQLGGSFNCSPSAENNVCIPSVTTLPVGESCKYSFPPGSTLFRLITHAYYIGSSQNIPSLFNEKLIVDTVTHDADTLDELVVQGVENMQILYGVDTDADDIPDQYVTANNIGAGTVSSVRIHLLIRSIKEVGKSIQNYSYLGNTITPTDKFLRKEFTTTIKLRNRGLL